MGQCPSWNNCFQQVPTDIRKLRMTQKAILGQINYLLSSNGVLSQSQCAHSKMGQCPPWNNGFGQVPSDIRKFRITHKAILGQINYLLSSYRVFGQSHCAHSKIGQCPSWNNGSQQASPDIRKLGMTHKAIFGQINYLLSSYGVFGQY